MLIWSSGRGLAGHFEITWVWIYLFEIGPHRATVWVEKRTRLKLGPGSLQSWAEEEEWETGKRREWVLGRQCLVQTSDQLHRCCWPVERAEGWEETVGSCLMRFSDRMVETCRNAYLEGSPTVDVFIGYSVPPSLGNSFPNICRPKSQPCFRVHHNSHSPQEASSPTFPLMLSLPHCMGSLAAFHTWQYFRDTWPVPIYTVCCCPHCKQLKERRCAFCLTHALISPLALSTLPSVEKPLKKMWAAFHFESCYWLRATPSQGYLNWVVKRWSKASQTFSPNHLGGLLEHRLLCPNPEVLLQ